MAWLNALLIFLVILAIIVVPLLLGVWLARWLRMPDYGWKIGVILLSLTAAAAVVATGWPPKAGIDLSGGVVLVYELDYEAMKEEGLDPGQVDMKKLIQALELRLNPAGVTGVSIRPYGQGQVEITIPQVRADDPQAAAQELAQVKNVLTSLGALQFRILANRRDHLDLIRRAEALPPEQTKVVNPNTGKPEAWWVPVAPGKETDFVGDDQIVRRTRKIGDKEQLEILVVADPFDVTGDYLVQATPATDSTGQPCVNFVFNSAGGYRFGRLTGNNVPDEATGFYRKLGIILDDQLQSAPQIRTTITTHGQITGRFTREETEALAAILNAGMLPAQLRKTPLSEQHIGPLLGRDTIIRGAWAIGISLAVVLLFMIFYYRFAGVVACLAVLANLLLLVAIMIAVNAEFSLPGIAGLVLTVGMAVDANVLIFERIREERDRGAALRMAIRNGFSRALSAIVDANLTTLMIAVILYAIPEAAQVRGFAVVLFLGVVLSMYTAIFCARVVFDIFEKQRWLTRLRMLRVFRSPQFNILGKRRVALAISGLLIVVGLVGVAARGRGLLDIDFTGGVSVEVLFEKPVNIAEVRKKLEGLPDLAVADVRYEGEEPGRRFRVTTSLSEYSAEAAQEAIARVVNEQLDRLAPGQSAEQRKELLDRLGESLKVLRRESAESAQYAAAWRRFHELLNDSLAGVSDPQQRQAAIEAVDAKLHEVLATPTELVEERIAQQFPGLLVSNKFEIVDLKPIAAAEHPEQGKVSRAEPLRRLQVLPAGGLSPVLTQLALGQMAEAGKADPDEADMPDRAGDGPAGPESQPGSDGSAPAPGGEGDQPQPPGAADAEPPGEAEAPAPSGEQPAAASGGEQPPGADAAAPPDEPAASSDTEEPGTSETPDQSGAASGAEEPSESSGTEGPPPESSGAEQPDEPTGEQTAPGAAEPAESESGEATGPGGPALPAAATPAEPQAPTGPPGTESGETPAEQPSTSTEPQAEQPSATESEAGQTPETPSAFAGGTQVTIKLAHPLPYDKLYELFVAELGSDTRLAISNENYKPGENVAFDTWKISLALPQEEAKRVLEAVSKRLENEPYFPSSTTVGSRVAGTLQEKGLLAVLASLICIVAYLWIRFQRVVYGLAAVVALVHDVLITLGLIALSAYLALIPGVSHILLIDPFKIGLTVLAAFLTIIGYSLNDTIVVFDRVREVKGKAPRLTEEIVNTSINQTLARTLLTSLTTLVVVLILYVGGGQPVHTFAFALVVGVIVGTYSSIFIASPFLLWMSQPRKEAQ